MGIFDWLLGNSDSPLPQDMGKKMAMIKKEGAESGNPRQQYNYGVECLNGENVPKDVNTGLAWLRKAADQNFFMAQFTLGNIYAKGAYGCSPDYRHALGWLFNAATQHRLQDLDECNKKLRVSAICSLGLLCARDEGDPIVIDNVIDLLEEHLDNIPCTYSLGCIFATGAAGKDIDEDRSSVFFLQMIVNDIRNSDTLSEHAPEGKRIECGYVDFDGSRLNFEKVIKYLSNFASKGITPALCAAGIIHWYGWRGAKLDRKLAVELIKRASTQGDDRASAILAMLLAENPEYSDEGDTSTAVTSSSNQTSLSDGQKANQLDEVKSILERVENGDASALKQLFSQAVDGNLNAQFELGRLYQLGQGFEKDVEKAEFWYVRAAKQGNELAQANLRSIDAKYRNWSMWD